MSLVLTDPSTPIKAVVMQAPILVAGTPPETAVASIGEPVGTVVRSISPPQKPNNVLWIDPPSNAVLAANQVSTTSQQDPDSPAPVPPVGTLAPVVGLKVKPASVAPQTKSMKRTLGIVVAVVLLTWFFLGFTFRSVL